TFAHGGGAYHLGPDTGKPLPEAIDMAAVLKVQTEGKLPDDLQQKFDAACLFRRRLDQLWRGEMAPGHGSLYEFAYELVWHIKPFGCFNPTEYAMIVAIRDQQSNAEGLEQRVTRCWINCRQAYGAEGFEPIEIDESKNQHQGSTQADADSSASSSHTNQIGSAGGANADWLEGYAEAASKALADTSAP